MGVPLLAWRPPGQSGDRALSQHDTHGSAGRTGKAGGKGGKGGENPAQEKKLARAGLSINPTAKEFGERYYTEQVLSRWKDPRTIRRYLDNEIFLMLGEKTLKDVNALDVQALVYRKRDNGRVQAAMQLRNVIKLIFDYAIEIQLVTINPAVIVATRFIGKARQRFRVLSPKEIRLYLRTVYQLNIRRQFKLALHIILLTLSRKSAGPGIYQSGTGTEG